MKNVVFVLISIFLKCFNSVSAQNLSESNDPINLYVKNIDILIKSREDLGLSPFFSESIKSKVRNIVGGSSYYFYYQSSSKKLLKVTACETIHYGYDNRKIKNPVSERIETELYYRNDSLVFARINEDNYNKERYFFQKQTMLNISDFDNVKFFENTSQKAFLKWVLDFSNGYRKKYYKMMKENEELLKYGISK